MISDFPSGYQYSWSSARHPSSSAEHPSSRGSGREREERERGKCKVVELISDCRGQVSKFVGIGNDYS